jgi:hypothetical protein
MGLFQEGKGRLIFTKSVGNRKTNINISTEWKIADVLKVDRRIVRHVRKMYCKEK